ncbi:MAG: glycosyltransferase family 4 protein [Candidatus Scalindua sp.]
MKILIGIPNPDARGGPSSCEPYLLEYFQTNDYTKVFTIVYGSHGRQKHAWRRILDTVNMCREMVKMAKKKSPDIIHINTAYDIKALLRDAFVVLYLRLANIRVKLFLKFHGSNVALLSRNLVWKLITSLLLNNVNGVGVLSKEEKNNFSAAYPELKDKFYIVKNVVNSSRFLIKSDFREKHKISSQVIVFLFIARFIKTKGILEVINAFFIVKERYANIHLLLIGDGEMAEPAKDLVTKLGLVKEVTFTGYVDEAKTPEIYLDSDILVFPTSTEGFSMTVFNSAAAGLPIITSRIRAAADYLREPDNCLWIEPNDCKMLAEKMIYLINHPQLTERMAINNRKLAQQFSSERVGLEFLKIYSKMLVQGV